VSILVGRNQELDLLAEALRAASRGTGGCLLLTGEAGIGKSRLLAELKQRASAEDFTILQGNCFEQSLSFPYAPWIDALRLSFDSLDAAQISELLGPLAPEFTKLLPELALLIPSLEPSTVLEPLAEKYRLFESFARLGASLSASAPLLLILEDLHWADALSLELVHYFVRRIHDRSILLVGTYRTEEAPPPLLRLLSELDRERLAREILLGPLSHADVERLARALLETAQPVPDAFVTALLSLTEGNPFFIEEVLKNLTEEGRAGQLLQQQSLGELPVPHSIQRMVQQRVEQLPDATQAVLVHAALIGERFDFGLLQETTARSEQELLHALKESLTCDAISSMVMLRERRAIHQTIGAALERLAGTRLEAPAAQLAYHFYQGGVWQKALECSQRAGQQAQALYAPREAITHFTRALDAAQQLGAASPYACLRGRAQGYEVLGEFEHARRDYEAALEPARGAAARAGRAR
jgi:predicted ATPase